MNKYFTLWAKSRLPPPTWAPEIIDFLHTTYQDRFVYAGRYAELETRVIGKLSTKLRLAVQADESSPKPYSKLLHRQLSAINSTNLARILDEKGGVLQFGGLSVYQHRSCSSKPYPNAELALTMRLTSNVICDQLCTTIKKLCVDSNALQFFVSIGNTRNESHASHYITPWEHAAARMAANASTPFAAMHTDASIALRGIACVFGFCRSCFSNAYELTSNPPLPWRQSTWTTSNDSIRALILPQLQPIDPASTESQTLQDIIGDYLPSTINC